MSAVPRKNARGETVYRYDFIIKGKRYLSETNYPTKAAARTAERLRRTKIAEGKEGSREDLTLGDACAEWWRDHGQNHRSAAAIDYKIKTIIRLIGKDKLLIEIKTADVNKALQRRRREPVVNAAAAIGAKKRGKAYAGRPRSAAATNRDIIDQLRPILYHAARMHELSLPRIDWKNLRIKEPKKTIRHEFSPDEIAAWETYLGQTEKEFVSIATFYGARFGEMFFPPDAVRGVKAGYPTLELGRYKGRSGEFRESRKDETLHTVPLMQDHGALLSARSRRAAAAGLDVIWFDERRQKDGTVDLVEITYWGMNARLKTAARKAGLDLPRLIHAMRHHAATQIVRRTGSLHFAQQALGHKQIKTTERYAHINAADLRAAFLEVSRQSPAGMSPEFSSDQPKLIENK